MSLYKIFKKAFFSHYLLCHLAIFMLLGSHLLLVINLFGNEDEKNIEYLITEDTHRAGVDFHQCFTSSFYMRRSQKPKKTLMSLPSFSAFGIWVQFHQRSTYNFYARRSRKRKKIQLVISIFLRLRDLRAQKLYVKH